MHAKLLELCRSVRGPTGVTLLPFLWVKGGDTPAPPSERGCAGTGHVAQCAWASVRLGLFPNLPLLVTGFEKLLQLSRPQFTENVRRVM